MNRPNLAKLALVIAGAVVSSVALRATTVTQIHPPAGGTNAPVQIVVLADHYSKAQEQDFNYDVENFFKYGVLVDDYYKQQLGNLRIVSVFDDTPAGQESRFDFEIGTGDGNCLVKAGTDTLTKLMAATPTNIVPKHYLVIGNHPYAVGCTTAEWSYVAVDAVGTDVLPHEFGHVIGGLFDEWGMEGNGTHPGLITDRLNCAPTAPPAPHWHTGFSGYVDDPGCDLHTGGVVHPYALCRMGASHHKKFCDVCKAVMDASIMFENNPNLGNPPIQSPQITNPNPPTPHASHEPSAASGGRIVRTAFAEQPAKVPPAPPPDVPRPVMRVVVDFDPESPGTSTVRNRTFATGVYVPSYRRLGEYLYEVLDVSGTREVGVLSDQLFKARGHRGAMLHDTGARRRVQVILDVPNEDAKTVTDAARRLRIVIYRIPSTIKVPIINRSQFAELMKTTPLIRVAELPLQ